MGIDFLILIENIKRGELENACLLANELRKRGYVVRVSYYRRPSNALLVPKVVIVPDCYSNNEVVSYAYFVFGKEIKIINLQYEQVLSISSEDLEMYKISDFAKDAMHIAWGEDTKNRLKRYGVSENHIEVTGAISMDWYSCNLKRYFKDRQSIATEFDLDTEKKWYVFASNFTLTNQAVFNDCANRIPDADLISERQGMIDNKGIFIEWLESSLDTYKDCNFIYRPHPDEKSDPYLKKLEERYSNFHVISKYSLRQWVMVTDILAVYMSTSIVDAYYCGIPAYVIRPVEIAKDIDSVLLIDANKVREKEVFLKSIEQTEAYIFPIEKTIIENYYGSFTDGQAYRRICDACEVVYKNNSYNISMETIRKLRKIKISRLKERLMLIFQELNCYLPIYKMFKHKPVSYIQLQMDYWQSVNLRKQYGKIMSKIEDLLMSK